jgi:hypothetical protein
MNEIYEIIGKKLQDKTVAGRKKAAINFNVKWYVNIERSHKKAPTTNY